VEQSYNAFWGISSIRISGLPNIHWSSDMNVLTDIKGVGTSFTYIRFTRILCEFK
jgi:hypothetical protein